MWIGMGKLFYRVIGAVLILLGFMYLLHSFTGITGLVIVEEVDKSISGFFGFGFTALGFFFLSLAKSRKKGQAAFELMVTYGWAILAAMAALLGLAFFGVFSLGTSSSVLLSAPFFSHGVEAQAITGESGIVRVDIRNDAGERKVIERINVALDKNSASCSYIGPYTIDPGESYVFSLSCDQELSAQQSIKGDITIIYTNPGSNLEQQTTGTFTTKTVSGSDEADPLGGGGDDSVCGNGLVETGEECDDGNDSGEDGCSAECEVESGWDCSNGFGEPSTCTEICGDEIVVGDEVCDSDTQSCEVSRQPGTQTCLSDCSGYGSCNVLGS